MRAMMSSAMGGADFEYLKTADIRERYMGEEEERTEPSFVFIAIIRTRTCSRETTSQRN